MPWIAWLLCIVAVFLGLIWLTSMVSFLGKLFFIVLIGVLGYEVARRLWSRTRNSQ